MKVLVTHGSERGGTAEIAAQIANELRAAGLDADLYPARAVRDVRPYDAIIVGGALYALSWHADARRFVLRHARALRKKEVWLFSSGPLDDSASRGDIPPVAQVEQLMAHVGARGHATFGGRLAADASGFIASKMAKDRAGDFRDRAQIEAWARKVAAAIRAPAPAHRAPAPLPSRALPLGLALFTAVTAMGGGAVLIASPDGSLVRFPAGTLDHTPFHDFLLPGLILFVLVGLLNALAAWVHWIRAPLAAFASFAGGCSLLVWITVEMIMLRTLDGLQITYLLVALALLADAVHRIRVLFAAFGAASKHLPPAAHAT
ncbi:MAG: flavodoxin domain-containing protein [Byssovorax sp.]